MMLNVICFRNNAIECFTTPQFVDLEPSKAAEQLKRSLILNKDDVAKCVPYRNLVLFNIGTFDDNTGKIELLERPVELLDCSRLLDDLGVFKEVQIDG